MKTTSCEISKQLAEAGFNKYKIPEGNCPKASAVYCWHNFLIGAELEDKTTETLAREYDIYPAYDLETILEALPNFIANGNGTENCLVVDVAFGEIHYKGDCESDTLFITTTRNNESLADTAARLLILLHEKGLINFNEEKQ
jgi:hypothetical protein